MRAGRPIPLAELEREAMYALAGTKADHRRGAIRTLDSAQSFRTAADRARADNLLLPAVSQYHEAARLAVTAVATLSGRRFANAAGAHEAVVDYALAIGVVDARQHAQLDALRELRH